MTRLYESRLLTDIHRLLLSLLINERINTEKNFFFLFHFVEQRAKAQETNDDPLAEMEMANVIARKQKRPGNKTSSTVYSSNEVNNQRKLLRSICCIFVFVALLTEIQVLAWFSLMNILRASSSLIFRMFSFFSNTNSIFFFRVPILERSPNDK